MIQIFDQTQKNSHLHLVDQRWWYIKSWDDTDELEHKIGLDTITISDVFEICLQTISEQFVIWADRLSTYQVSCV